MAWRVAEQVVRGELDNRVRGLVTGRLWLAGREAPLTLTLTGNPLRDIAGCQVRFENPGPEAGEVPALADLQRGVVGDLTASRKVRVLDVSVTEALARAEAGQPVPEHLGNGLYLEWFSEANGRVVIESADFRVRVSEPAWRMTPAEAREQGEANARAMADFVARLCEAGATEEPGEADGRSAHHAAAALVVGVDAVAGQARLAGAQRAHSRHAGRPADVLARFRPLEVAPVDGEAQRLEVGGFSLGGRGPARSSAPIEDAPGAGHGHLPIVGVGARGEAAPRKQVGDPVRGVSLEDRRAFGVLDRGAERVADADAQQAAPVARPAPGIRSERSAAR